MRPISYVLPIRRTGGEDLDELSDYLGWLSARAEVLVVDGSARELFEEGRARWGEVAVHVPPDPAHRCLNGKVSGVLTGVRLARHEAVVVADDDVRYDAASLESVADALADADLVQPQNFFSPLPWHAAWDTSRTLLNRCWGADSPGTLGIRRSRFLAMGGYDGDVLYENLELIRTVVAAGGTVAERKDIHVRRLPPTARRFWEQRIRQAYDDFAQPWRMALFLAVGPGVAAGLVRRRRWPAAVAAASVGMAEVGRRRAGGRGVFPARTSWFAPLWVTERCVCAWLAVGARARGGVRYGGRRLTVAAHSDRELRARGAGRRLPTADVAPVAEGGGSRSAAPAQGDDGPAQFDRGARLVLDDHRAAHQERPVPVGPDGDGGVAVR